MARRKTESDGESDLVDRNLGGGMETGDATERAVVTDYSQSPEYVAAQEATKHDAAVEDEASAARVAAAPTGGAAERAAIKRANFSRLASKRVSGVLERLSVLKQLSNTSTYDWTLEQHNKIFFTIQKHLDDVAITFENAKKTKDKSQLRFEV